MHAPIESQIYLPGEIAAAAGVEEADVIAALDGVPRYVGHSEAVALATRLRRAAFGTAGPATTPPAPLASYGGTRPAPHVRVPLAVSGSVHAIVLAVAMLATQAGAPASTAPQPDDETPARLVFLSLPGPGGGGGGGGRRQVRVASRAMRTGTSAVNSPVPQRRTPPAVEPPAQIVQPPAASPAPEIVAPVVPSPADTRDIAGTPDGPPAPESAGPGLGAGAGSGAGSGSGSGNGSGLGDGSGGGTGGGPYRPGSGISPPRLLREVKPTYTDAALRAGITGETLLEVMVRRDGSVGQVEVLHGLGSGLDQRAVDAVRQWRFAPALRQGQPVDVLVEVSVAFSVR